MKKKNKDKILKITSDKTGRPGNVTVKLLDPNGVDSDSLGLVQSVTWKASVGEMTGCIVETIMTPVELEIFAKNAEFRITVMDRETK